MRHLKGAVWTERLLLVLIVASMAGTLNLVIAVHRRVRTIEADRARPQSTAEDVKPPRPVVVAAPRPVSAPPKSPVSVPAPPPAPAKPPEDPTVAILARIDRAIAREVVAAREADRRAEAHEAAIRRSEAESQRWKRREMLVRQQVAALDRRADKAEIEVATLDAERDVLEKERDILKAATAKASQKTGYAILPYKGPNGTWRRPIVLECSGDSVKLQPSGRVFTALELSPLINPRVSPLVLAIAREMVHIQQSDTPDGAPAVPYLVFMVRPDGIRPYYRLRERLEPLGVAFGYELIEQDLAVNIPNLDDLTTWDGSVPLDSPELAELEASRRRLAATRDQEQPKEPEKDAAGQSQGWPPADRVAANDPNTAAPAPAPAPGNRPSAGASDRPGISGGRWPDLASGGAPPPLSREAPGRDGNTPPEIDLNGALERGQRAAMGRPGASNGGESSPDDFVWPSQAGSRTTAAGGGASRGVSRGWGGGNGQGNNDVSGSGNVGALARLSPSGSSTPGARPGSPPRSGGNSAEAGDLASAFGSGSPPAATDGAGDSSFPRGGGFGSGSAAGSTSGAGSAAGSSSGTDTGGPGSGGSRRVQGGPVDLSPGRFGVGVRRGTSPSGNTGSPRGGSAFAGAGGPSGTGSAGRTSGARSTGPAGGDALPDLEPAQDGAAKPVRPSSAKPSTSQRPPGGSSATTGGPAETSAPGGPGDASSPGGSANAPAPGGPADAPATAGANTPMPDPGFTAFSGGPPSGMPQPAGAGAGPGSLRAAGSGPMTGGTPPPGSAGTNEPPPLAEAGTGAGPSQGSADPSQTPPDVSGTPTGGGSGNSGYGSGSSSGMGGTSGASSSGRASGSASPSSASPGTAGADWGTPPPTPPSASNLPQANGPAVQGTPPPGDWSAMKGNPPPSFNGTPPPVSPSLASSLPPSLANVLDGLASGSSNSSSANNGGSTSPSSSSSSSSSSTSSSWSSASTQPTQSSSSTGQGLSLPDFSMSPDPDSEPDSLKPLAQPPIDLQRRQGQIDVPFEIVAVCRRDDILLHPGGYRITRKALEARAAGGNQQEDLLKRELQAIVRKRALVDPLIRPKPRIKFLIETGGGTTFWTARQQLTFSDLDWPMSMQVAGPQTALLPDDQEVTRR